MPPPLAAHTPRRPADTGEVTSRRPLAAVLAAATAALVAAAPAHAATPTSASSRAPAAAPAAAPASGSTLATRDDTGLIATRLAARGKDARLGSAYSAAVTDVATGRTIWSRSATQAYLPASVNKVTTAYVAMRSIGPDARLYTRTYQSPTSRSTVYLKGGGDPTLSRTRLGWLADATARSLAAQRIRSVSLRVDDTLFAAPTSAYGWKSSYVPGEVAPVRALVVDSRNVWDTSMDAAASFASELRRRGITVGTPTRAAVPKGSTQISYTQSPLVRDIIGAMLSSSINDYAEALLRVSAARRGYSTTWTGATTNAQRLLVAAGVPTSGWRMYDGSGLSRADRMPVATMNGLLRVIARDSTLRAVFLPWSSLPVAGRTGTLSSRFRTSPTSCAAGIVHAKTGTLSDVVALAGVARGVDGRERVFTVIVNSVRSTTSARAGVDLLATTATGCY